MHFKDSASLFYEACPSVLCVDFLQCAACRRCARAPRGRAARAWGSTRWAARPASACPLRPLWAAPPGSWAPQLARAPPARPGEGG